MGKRETFGVAFAGGGIKSFSEYSFVRWMEENQLKADAVAGTSMGAMMAALYACDLPLTQYREILLGAEARIRDEKIFSPATSLWTRMTRKIRGGIVDSGRLESIVTEIFDQLDVHTLKDVKIPLAINAVDLISGDLVVFVSHPTRFSLPHRTHVQILSDVPIAKAITASASFPFVITPTPLNDRLLVDGGVYINCPVELVKGYGVDQTVALTMMSEATPQHPENMLAMLTRLYDLMMADREIMERNRADLQLNFPLPPEMIFKVGSARETMEKAEKVLVNYEDQLNQMLRREPGLAKRIRSFFFKD